MSAFPRPVRIRTGIARFPDGWKVIVEFDGQRSEGEASYASEADAEAAAKKTAAVIRRAAQ